MSHALSEGWVVASPLHVVACASMRCCAQRTVQCNTVMWRGVGGWGLAAAIRGVRAFRTRRLAYICVHVLMHAKGCAARSAVSCLAAITAAAAQERERERERESERDVQCPMNSCMLCSGAAPAAAVVAAAVAAAAVGLPYGYRRGAWRVLAGTLGFPARARGAAAWESAGALP